MRAATKHPSPPRDVDTLLWRGSSELRNWIQRSASTQDVSQNAVMTAALLIASVLDEVPKYGPPKNVLKLLDEIESALSANLMVSGIFHIDDWASTQACIETFVKVGLITEPLTKTDARVPTAVAFSFLVTRGGVDVLPTVIRMLRPVFAAMLKEGESMA